jgi:predicted sulfurtransferase
MMPRWSGWLALMLLAGLPALGWAQEQPDLSTAPRISQAEFKKLQAASEVLVVDVRDAESFKAGHIPGAILVPLNELPQHLDELRASKKPIVTYCA